MDMQMELTSDQRVLIDDKNRLNETSLERYRLAGQIAQTGLVFVQGLLKNNHEAERSVGEICRLGDAFLQKATANVFKRQKVEEKGIALPVQIEKDEFVCSVAPEEGDVFQGGFLKEGDVAKITLGVHIDGYTAQVSHSFVIRDRDQDLRQEPQPLVGTKADAVCAAYIATEAVISLLSLVLTPNATIAAGEGPITGQKIKTLVEKIATIFRVKVAPGSRVRRVRRFLAGQSDVVQENDFKGVTWDEAVEEERALSRIHKPEESSLSNEFADDFAVQEGEVWLVDLRMAATEGKNGVVKTTEFTGYGADTVKPSIYSRDYAVQYGLKINAARTLLSRSAALTSVYPFKLSYVAENASDLASAKLGLSELVQHHIFVPQTIRTAEFVPLDLFVNGNPSYRDIKKASKPVPVAREMSTIVLLSAAESHSGFSELIRLTGGNKTAPPSWVHSNYEVTDPTINELLQFKANKKLHGINFQDVQPSKFDMAEAIKPIDNSMDLD
ncbi:hypothetical protein TRICI_005355 [Trichomonascus ciferrii]|uniref:Probable metalloprotease ARX1 n=1 Tax=Trichomonascus ciferrii TaxID=44093 RepID=A0A642UTD4_9ASCO|nr:hypothetical protein TRICI_005355 [Trichomonascus ciferrii]